MTREPRSEPGPSSYSVAKESRWVSESDSSAVKSPAHSCVSRAVSCSVSRAVSCSPRADTECSVSATEERSSQADEVRSTFAVGERAVASSTAPARPPGAASALVGAPTSISCAVRAIGGGNCDARGRGVAALARAAANVSSRTGGNLALGGGAAPGAARKPATQPASLPPFCQRSCEVLRLQGDCMDSVLRGSRTCMVNGRGTDASSLITASVLMPASLCTLPPAEIETTSPPTGTSSSLAIEPSFTEVMKIDATSSAGTLPVGNPRRGAKRRCASASLLSPCRARPIGPFSRKVNAVTAWRETPQLRPLL